MAHQAGTVKRGPVVIVFRLNVCSMIQQHLDNLRVSKKAGLVKRRPVNTILGVDVNSNTQKPFDLC
jgi:hypothetical protein